VARDEDSKCPEGDKFPTWHSLYRTIGGSLYFFDCFEEEVGNWDVHVELCYTCWAHGKDLEEVRADFRYENAPDAEIPSILESPPPEVEEMHKEIDYDS
jgi:hypothetical protein